MPDRLRSRHRFFKRRAFALVCGILTVISLTSCNKKDVSAPSENPLTRQSGHYETTASISYKELKAEARITQESPQSCSVTFTSPESLQNMAFVFHGDTVDLSYKGLSFSFDPQSLPGGAVAQIAVSSINRAMKDDGVTMDYSAGALTLSGIMESGSLHCAWTRRTAT